MDNAYIFLKEVNLTGHFKPTGQTIHLHGDAMLRTPAKLQIVQIKGAVGFYLLYLDKDGTELTDTYHDSLLDAMEQAEFEFEVKANDWRDSQQQGRGS